MSLWSSIVEKIVSELFRDERRFNVQEFLSESDKHKPSTSGPLSYSYRTEMENRLDYLRGAMQEDMEDELERRFPKTHDEIKKEQLNLKIYRRQIAEKAKVFVETGEFWLSDEQGEKIDDPNFDDMIAEARVMLNLKSMDQRTRACHRTVVKAWWDSRREHARVSVWTPNLVHVIPSTEPGHEWDIDRALVVGFERLGEEGINDTDKRYEIWGYRPDEIAEATGAATLHFMAQSNTSKPDHRYNDGDVNPYVDPRSGDPMYPFVLFADDDETQMWVIGDEDALTVNRAVNSGLTDIRQILHCQAFGVWVHTMGDGAQEFGNHTLSPGRVYDLQPGASLANVAPELKCSEVWEFWKSIVDASDKLENLSASVIQRDDAAPESGRALKIREKPQMDERKDMIGIYQEQVEEFLYRLCVVHNAHCEPSKRINLDRCWPRWNAGEPEIPSDPQEVIDVAMKEKTMQAATAVDYLMAKQGLDRDEAEKLVRENAEFNRALAELTAAAPLYESAMQRREQIANPPTSEPEKDEDEDKDEDEGDGGQ